MIISTVTMALTTHISQIDKTQSPYKIDPEQTLRASQALLKHVQAEVSKIRENSGKKNLLAKDDSDLDEDEENAQPIWLHITTKTFTEDRHRLKPTKIQVPHSLRRDDNLTICLITTDPQRAVKNVVADPVFPKSLATRISKIIGLSKLQARYKTFEQRRQLLAEHDVFLADDRIITRLPKALGKVFYQGTAKRPIPINLAPSLSRNDASKPLNRKVSKDERTAEAGNPQQIAREIEKALTSVPVTLPPGHNIPVRVALHTFNAEQIQENVITVTNGVIDRLVVNGWRNVKSIHIKTSNSVAVPIWLSEDVFIANKENDSIHQSTNGVKENGTAASETSIKKRKRSNDTKRGPQSGERKKARATENKAREKEDAAGRKARLSSQKASVFDTEI